MYRPCKHRAILCPVLLWAVVSCFEFRNIEGSEWSVMLQVRCDLLPVSKCQLLGLLNNFFGPKRFPSIIQNQGWFLPKASAMLGFTFGICFGGHRKIKVLFGRFGMWEKTEWRGEYKPEYNPGSSEVLWWKSCECKYLWDFSRTKTECHNNINIELQDLKKNKTQPNVLGAVLQGSITHMCVCTRKTVFFLSWVYRPAVVFFFTSKCSRRKSVRIRAQRPSTARWRSVVGVMLILDKDATPFSRQGFCTGDALLRDFFCMLLVQRKSVHKDHKATQSYTPHPFHKCRSLQDLVLFRRKHCSGPAKVQHKFFKPFSCEKVIDWII